MARSAHPETTAVVVTCGSTPYLGLTLQGIFDQTHTPTRVVIVNIWSKGRDLGTGDDIQALVTEIGLDTITRVRVLAAPGSTTFGDAVRRGLELNTAAQQRADKLHETRTGEIPIIRSDTSPGWLWLLHDDSAPHASALERLLRTGESGPSIAVVGAKQRAWENPDNLIEVGIRATSSARRFNPIEDDEIDQGQFDHLDDVLAVGLAGAIVRRDVWTATAGPDPALGPFGDGLEFSRRVRLSGYRVVVEPTAIVFHARASYLGLRSFGHGRAESEQPDVARSYGARRKAQLYNWILATAAWKLPFLLLFLLILTPARALARFIGKDMIRARAELRAGTGVLSRPDLWLAARKRTRKTARISASRLAPLEADSADIRRARREQRHSESDLRRTIAAPSELEMRELAALNTRRRAVAVVVAFAAIVVSMVPLFALIGAPALTGGALLPDSADLGTLWDRALSGWIATGDGYRGPADPILAVLSVPLIAGISLATVLKWSVLLAVPASALTAWAAAGTATRSTSLRAFAALVWAAGPLTFVAVSEGRIGAIMAHVAAPLVIAATARAVGLRRRDHVLSGLADAQRDGDDTPAETDETADVPESADGPEPADAPELADTPEPAHAPEPTVVAAPEAAREHPSDERRPSLGAAAFAALAFIVVAAGSPPLLVIGTALLTVMTVLSRFRSTIWFIPVPALVLYGPWLQETIREGTWRAVFSSPGVPISAEPAEPWEMLFGAPSQLSAGTVHDLLLLVPGIAVLAVALLALLRGTGRARAVRVGFALAVIGFAAALYIPEVTVAHTSAGLPVNGWAGHGITLMTLGLLTAAISGSDGVRGLLAHHAFGARHVAVFTVSGIVAIATLAGPVAWLLSIERSAEIGDAHSVMTPALSRQLAAGEGEARTLALIPDEDALRAEVWRGDGPQMSETSMLVAARAVTGDSADDAAQSLADAVGYAAVGGRDDVAEALAAHAIGVVLVPHEQDASQRAQRQALIAVLATAPGVVFVTENEAGAVYRVISDDPTSRASAVGRAQMFDGDDFVRTLPMTAAIDPAGSSLTVTLAERADPGWIAHVDGVRLSAEADGWAQSFSGPTRGGDLTIEYQAPFQRAWHWVQAIAVGLTAILALPVRRRRREVAT